MILISKVNKNVGGKPALIKGNKYYGALSPMMYDKDTFQPQGRCYIVTVSQDVTHKYPLEFFEELGEYRESRLKDILS
jgi:hypothetical protein